MAEYCLLVIFLFFSVNAETFPNCEKKITCKTVLYLQHRVSGMMGKLEELSMTQYNLKLIEQHLFLGKRSLSTCINEVRQLKSEFGNLKRSAINENTINSFNQSLIRQQKKNNLLENKLNKLEEDIRFNVAQKLKEHETADKNGMRNLSEIQAEVENKEETVKRLQKDIEDKVDKSEFLKFKEEINGKIQTLHTTLNKVERTAQNFPFQKNKIIQEQKKSISSIHELKQKIEELKKDLDEKNRQQSEKFASLQDSLKEIKELLALKTERNTSSDTSDENWVSALNKGIDLLKQTGGIETSRNSTSSRTEESFSEHIQP